MTRWTATIEELREDFARMAAAHYLLPPVETDACIAYHDAEQEAAKLVFPAPRMMAALMHGGVVKGKRWVGECAETGRPVFEGVDEVMRPLSHDEAVAFIAFRDIPKGCNHFAILSAADLPRVEGSVETARKFRGAWRLEEAA